MEAVRCVGSRDRVVRITLHHQCLAALGVSRGPKRPAAELPPVWSPLCNPAATESWLRSWGQKQKPLGLGEAAASGPRSLQHTLMANASDPGTGSSSESQDCQVIQSVQATMPGGGGRLKRTAARKRPSEHERKQKRQKMEETEPIEPNNKVPSCRLPSCRLLNSCPVGSSTVLSQFTPEFLTKRGYTDLLALSLNGALVQHGFVLWLYKESSTRSHLQLGNAVMDEGWALDTDDACREVMLAYQEKVTHVPGLTVRGLIDGYIQLCTTGQWGSAAVAQRVQASVQKLQQAELDEAYLGRAVEDVVQELEGETGEASENGHDEAAAGGETTKKRKRSGKKDGDKKETVLKKRGTTAANSNGTGREAFAFGRDGWANATPAKFSGGLLGAGQATHTQAPTPAVKQTERNGREQGKERPIEAQGIGSMVSEQPSLQGRPPRGHEGSMEQPADMSSGGTEPLIAKESAEKCVADAETGVQDGLAPVHQQKIATRVYPQKDSAVALDNQSAAAGNGRASLPKDQEALRVSKETGSGNGEAGGSVPLSMQGYEQLVSLLEASSREFVARLLTKLEAQQACEAALRAAHEEASKEKQTLLLLIRYQQREMSALRKEKAVHEQQESELAAREAVLAQEKEEQEQTFKMRVLKGVAEGLGLPGAL